MFRAVAPWFSKWFYTKIAKRRAENENGIVVRTSSGREEQHAIDEPGQLSNTENK